MADGDSKAAMTKPTMGYIIDDIPSDTLDHCASIVRFIANRATDIGSTGVEFNDDDRDAIFRILHTVADAIQYEQQRAEVRQ